MPGDWTLAHPCELAGRAASGMERKLYSPGEVVALVFRFGRSYRRSEMASRQAFSQLEALANRSANARSADRSILMIAHGLLGPALSPKNLATSLTWVYFRGVLVLVLLCAGKFLLHCLSVRMLVRDLGRRSPRAAIELAARTAEQVASRSLLLAGDAVRVRSFSLWASPWWTAWLIVATSVSILLVDWLFKHAAFCKFVCPIGQFNFAASTFSPLEVRSARSEICERCQTRGLHPRQARRLRTRLVTIDRGCELALFLPLKVGNMDCTFCLDCVHACPHDNIGHCQPSAGRGVTDRSAAFRRWTPLRRTDAAALAALLMFGALMNAFGMVSPVYAFERWLSRISGLENQTAILGIVFSLVVLAAPVVLLGSAGFLSARWAGQGRVLADDQPLRFPLMPLGFGMWLAHYGFHLLTGLFTLVPVTQDAIRSVAGTALLGDPRWTLVGLPSRIVEPIQICLLVLGLLGSLSLASHYAQEDSRRNWVKVLAPWAALDVILFAAGIWLTLQPMDMRATFLE